MVATETVWSRKAQNTIWSFTEKFAYLWSKWSWSSPMQSSNHLMLNLPKPDLSPRPYVSEWPILTHLCLLSYLCKGLPKAAVINYRRMWYALAFVTLSGIKKDDVIYVTLPLYHSSAFLIGLHGCIMTGKLFLSRRHWRSVHIHICS